MRVFVSSSGAQSTISRFFLTFVFFFSSRLGWFIVYPCTRSKRVHLLLKARRKVGFRAMGSVIDSWIGDWVFSFKRELSHCKEKDSNLRMQAVFEEGLTQPAKGVRFKGVRQGSKAKPKQEKDNRPN